MNRLSFSALGLLLLALPLTANADQLTFSALNGSWATAQSTGITGGARSLRVINPLTVPINVRWGTDADTGNAKTRVAAGDTVVIRLTDPDRPAEVSVYGIGGAGTVYVEAYSASAPVDQVSRVSTGLSSATPQAPGTAAAGTSVLGSAADHVHPLQSEGSIAESIAAESGNTRRVTLTISDAAGTVVNADTCKIELFTSAMAYVDGSANGAMTLVTGTALTTNATGANIRLWVTSNSSGVIAIDVIDKSSSLSGNLIMVTHCPATGTIKVSTVAFT